MRIRARRRPGVISRISRDAFEARRAHFFRDVVAEFGVALDDLFRHIRLNRLHVRWQEES